MLFAWYQTDHHAWSTSALLSSSTASVCASPRSVCTFSTSGGDDLVLGVVGCGVEPLHAGHLARDRRHVVAVHRENEMNIG